MAYRALQVKYHGPTNHRDSRFTVHGGPGTKSYSYNHELDIDENVKAAVRAHVEYAGWGKATHHNWIIGSLDDGTWVAVYPGLNTAVYMDK
ncbi:hypothetical protein MTR10_11925 [Staphylococcus agnetis]|uniref:hypothetical protein n=1 Tax=Staphylococcus agnetis TaxID=985762 RepID=UPI00208F13F6|nr:hypothetical protein [Staphylococcus agnetis]MCO4372746.1 hypothetical protein [Staphylococcus agnetis]